MKYNYINSFKINNDFSLEIEFNDKYKNKYNEVIDIYFNRNIGDNYPYDVIDYKINIVGNKDYSLIGKAFGMKYSKEFLDNNIKGKMMLLQIEGSLTLYCLFKSIEEK